MVITLVGSDIAAVELCCRPCIVLYYSLKPNTCIIIKKCQHYVECTIKAKRKECQSKCLTLKMEKKALFSFLCSTYCFSIHEYINNIYSEKKILSKKKFLLAFQVRRVPSFMTRMHLACFIKRIPVT